MFLFSRTDSQSFVCDRNKDKYHPLNFKSNANPRLTSLSRSDTEIIQHTLIMPEINAVVEIMSINQRFDRMVAHVPLRGTSSDALMARRPVPGSPQLTRPKAISSQGLR